VLLSRPQSLRQPEYGAPGRLTPLGQASKSNAGAKVCNASGESARLKAPVTADRKFEDVVNSAQNAAVLVLVN